jgi:hypothetical protein
VQRAQVHDDRGLDGRHGDGEEDDPEGAFHSSILHNAWK